MKVGDRTSRNIARIGLWLLVPLGLILLFRWTPLKTFTSLETITAWVEAARGSRLISASYYLIFPLLILGLPIAVFPVIGGILHPFWIALPLNMAAMLGGASIAFLIGKLLGRDIFQRLLGDRAGSFHQFQAEKGLRTVLLIRWIGVPPFLITNYAFGFTGFRYRHFFAGTALGILPWTVLVTFMADTLWSVLVTGQQDGVSAALRQLFGPISWIFLTFLLVVILLHRRIREKPPETLEG